MVCWRLPTAENNIHSLWCTEVPLYCVPNDLIITPAIILSLRPYKKDRYNYFDAFLLVLFAMGSAWYIYHEVFRNSPWFFVYIIVTFILVLYIVMFISWMKSSVTSRCGYSCCHRRRATHQTGSSTDNETLPHRISDPSEYAPLLPTTWLH